MNEQRWSEQLRVMEARTVLRVPCVDAQEVCLRGGESAEEDGAEREWREEKRKGKKREAELGEKVFLSYRRELGPLIRAYVWWGEMLG